MSKPNRTRDPGKIAAMSRTQPTHVAASVQQAIQRDPLQAMPGDEAAQRKHPVMQAIDLLINYDGNNEQAFNPEAYHEAGRQLQTYHAEQMGALQQASGRAEESTRQLSELIEDVAEMLDFDMNDRTAGEMLEVLRDRLNPPTPLTVDNGYLPDDLDDGNWRRLQQPQAGKPAVTPNEHAAIKNMHAVCTVLAKHFGDDPAVTFENASGLVEHVISDSEEFKEQAAMNAREREHLRGELQKRGGVTSPNPQETIDADALRQLVSEFGGGLVSHPVEVFGALREILTNLEKNQMPDGWQAHSQTLIDSNLRYEKVLAAMRNVMSLV